MNWSFQTIQTILGIFLFRSLGNVMTDYEQIAHAMDIFKLVSNKDLSGTFADDEGNLYSFKISKIKSAKEEIAAQEYKDFINKKGNYFKEGKN